MYRSVLTEVKPGQVVGMPVFPPGSVKLVPLVNRGAVISHAVLTHLLDRGVRSIWIQEEGTISVDRRLKIETYMALWEFATWARKFWQTCETEFQRARGRSSELTLSAMDSAVIQAQVRKIAEVLRYDSQRVMAIQALPRLPVGVVDRMVMRTLFGIILGLELEGEIFAQKLEKIRKVRRNLSSRDYQSAKDLTSLAVGCLLLELPDWAKEWGGEELEERDLKGYAESLSHITEQFPDAMARMMIRCRHQNFDGSGLPKSEHKEEGSRVSQVRGMMGPEIHILARVSRVVDVFLSHLTPHNSYLEALSRMQDEALNRLDPILVDTFLQILPPFPVGSQVVLNNGELAVVLRENAQNPCRPLVYRLGQGITDDRQVDLERLPLTVTFVETSLDAPSVSCMDFFFANISIPMF
ncbi:MAG: hypothetical protein AB7F75_12085 [Planctomycetota bacterium]